MSSSPPQRTYLLLDQASPWLVLVALALGVVFYNAVAHQLRGFDARAFGLGRNTIFFHDPRPQPGDGGVETNRLGFKESVPSLAETIAAHHEHGATVVLWIGNSQLHGVNAFQAGDELAVTYANAASNSNRERLIFLQNSAGNASFHDMLAMYLEARQAGQLPDILVVSLTYDDLRGTKIQKALVQAIPNLEFDGSFLSPRALASVEELRKQRASYDAGQGPEAVERTATGGTPQERTEEALTGALEKIWPSYANRGDISGWIELRARVATQDAVRRLKRAQLQSFGAPPVPEPVKQWNKNALRALFELARHDGVEVVMYRQPHIPGQEPFFHIRAKYDAFFEDVQAEYEPVGVTTSDMETLVPSQEFGLNNWGLPDPFHFSSRGHRLLGRAIHDLVADQVVSKDARAVQ